MTDPPTRRRRLILLTVLTTASLTHFDATMVAVALPRIRQGLSAGDGQLHWVVTSYLLAFGLVLLLGGRMGDVLGRRTMCLTGQALFMAGALAAALAPSVEFLIAARVAQGIGAGFLLPQGAALIQQLFPPRQRGKAFASLGVAISIATSLGPVISGAFLSAAPGPESWRWLFVFYLPVSITILILVARLYPGAPDGTARIAARLDLLGALLAGTVVSAALYPFMAQAATPLTQRPWYTIALAVLAALLLARHIRARSSRHEPSIIDPALRAVPHYPIGAAVGALYFSGFVAVPVVLSLVLQEGLGLGPLVAAALIAPWSLGNGIGAPFGGRGVVRFGRRLVAVGAAVSAVAVIGAALAVGLTTWPMLPYVLAPAMLLGGIGTGLTIGPNLTVTLRYVDPIRAGGASALIQTTQRLGAALGTGMAVGVLFALLDRGYSAAGAWALAVSVGFMLTCGALALSDVILTRRRGEESAFGEE